MMNRYRLYKIGDILFTKHREKHLTGEGMIAALRAFHSIIDSLAVLTVNNNFKSKFLDLNLR